MSNKELISIILSYINNWDNTSILSRFNYFDKLKRISSNYEIISNNILKEAYNRANLEQYQYDMTLIILKMEYYPHLSQEKNDYTYKTLFFTSDGNIQQIHKVILFDEDINFLIYEQDFPDFIINKYFNNYDEIFYPDIFKENLDESKVLIFKLFELCKLMDGYSWFIFGLMLLNYFYERKIMLELSSDEISIIRCFITSYTKRNKINSFNTFFSKPKYCEKLIKIFQNVDRYMEILESNLHDHNQKCKYIGKNRFNKKWVTNFCS